MFASKTEATAAYDVAAKLYGKRLNYLQAQTNPEINVEIDQLPSFPTPWLGVRKIGSRYRAEIVDDNTPTRVHPIRHQRSHRPALYEHPLFQGTCETWNAGGNLDNNLLLNTD